jgi:type VI secretion system protein VasJ
VTRHWKSNARNAVAAYNMNVALMSKFDDARALFGAAPFVGDMPAGTDVRGGAEYETLEAELRRMDVDGPAAVDWDKVGSLALGILSSQSKDVLVASWATFALFRTEGYRGLAVGLEILRGMVDAHWDGLFPPPRRERARVSSIEWLVGRVAPALAETNPAPADQAAVLAAYDALNDLDRLLGERLQKERASLGDLFRALKPHRDEVQRAVDSAAAGAARALEQAADGNPQPVVQAAPAAETAEVGPNTDWQAFAGRLPEMLRQTGSGLRAKSSADPRAYLLNRIGSWLRFDALPSDTGGQTAVFPPADGVGAIETALSAGRHAEVVEIAEDLAWNGAFWLDSHRHCFTALEQLGPAMQPAAAAVRAAVVLLVSRYPNILALRFNDGRPFADDETRSWLANDDSGKAAPAKNPADLAAAEAQKLLVAGHVQGAFDALARVLNDAKDGRERFLCQLAQARFCMDRGFVTTAVPLLEHLDSVTTDRALDTWEPALALAVAELRYRAITHSDAQPLMDEIRRRTAVEQIRSRVARLDIGIASQLAAY